MARAAHNRPAGDDVARNLIRGREWARQAGRVAVCAALRAACRPWDQVARFTWWDGHVLGTFTGTAQKPGRGHRRADPFVGFCERLASYAGELHVKPSKVAEWDAGFRATSSGVSRYLGSSDGECELRTALFLDADGVGGHASLRAALDDIGTAYVIGESGGNRPDLPKWHGNVFLAEAIQVPLHLGPTDFAAWKCRWYRPRLGWLLGVLSELAELTYDTTDKMRVGFDPTVRRLLNPEYPGCRRKPEAPTPAVLWRDLPVTLDWTAALTATGYTDEPEKAAGARQKTSRLFTPGDPRQGDHPIIPALRHAGWLGQAIGSDRFVVLCPWRSSHTAGNDSDWTSSTVVWRSGAFFCARGSCQDTRRLPELVEALPPAARALYDDAMADETDTAGIGRLRRQLKEATTRMARIEVATLADARVRIATAVRESTGITLLRVPEGCGKTTTTLHTLAEAAASRMVYYGVPMLVNAEANYDLTTGLGIPSKALYGILAPRRGEPTTCQKVEVATAIAEAGGFPSLLCGTCEQKDGCTARLPLGDTDGAGFVHTSHQLLTSAAGGTKGKRATVVFDEAWGLVRPQALTGAAVASAADLLGWGPLAYLYRVRLAPWVEILGRYFASSQVLGHSVPLPDEPLSAAHDRTLAQLTELAEAYASDPVIPGFSPIGWDTIRAAAARPTRGKEKAVDVSHCSALEAVRRLVVSVTGSTNQPRLGGKALADLHAGQVTGRILAVFKLFAPINAAAQADARWKPYAEGLRVVTQTELTGTLRRLEEGLLLDARAQVSHLRAIKPELSVVEIQVADRTAVTRTVRYTARAGITQVLAKKAPDWSIIVPVFRDLFGRARRAGVKRLLVITFKALDEAIAKGDSPVQPLIAAWRKAGGELADHLPASILGQTEGETTTRQVSRPLRHYGELRSSNDYVTFDGYATLFDPRPNIGEHEVLCDYLGLNDDQARESLRDATSAELAQAHGRSRAVLRETPAWHIHYGQIAPDGWTTENARVAVAVRGRPASAPTVDPTEFATLVAVLGGTAKASERLRVPVRTLRHYLAGDAPVPVELARRLRMLTEKGVENGTAKNSLLRIGGFSLENSWPHTNGHVTTENNTANGESVPDSVRLPEPGHSRDKHACEHCSGPLKATARSDARFCSEAHKKAHARAAKFATELAADRAGIDLRQPGQGG